MKPCGCVFFQNQAEDFFHFRIKRGVWAMLVDSFHDMVVAKYLFCFQVAKNLKDPLPYS